MMEWSKTVSKYLLFPGSSVGGKGEQLIRLHNADYPVPKFHLLPAEYFDQVIGEEQWDAACKRIDDYEFSEEDKIAIFSALRDDCRNYSIRSSAMGEDGKEYSFAGQFDTFLYVEKEDVLSKIKEVWKSAFSDRIQFYRKQNNIEGKIRMAVVVQEMIGSDISGVMFGINPISQDPDEMLISSVYGLGEGLVSGELNADNYYIKHGKVDRTEIVEKAQKLIQSPTGSGTFLTKVSEEMKNISSLSDHQISELTEQLIALNAFYQFPQDVEWAFHDDQLYILQSRPITNLADRSGTRIIWDNSNIIESYPGITTPLTFSFIRDMYQVVYTQFSKLLGVSPKKLEQSEAVFANMLGILRGRVYYNLLSWYKALALLPGYKLNAEFMEGMMGVKEKFELKEEPEGGKISAWYRIFLTVVKMIKLFVLLPRDRRRFLSFLDKTIADYKKIDFENTPSEDLMNHYQEFEKVLTEKWDPPLINDFFAMIYFGVFQKLVAKWIGEENPHIHNDLLASSNDIISVQPMIQSLKLAESILKNPAQKQLFTTHTPKEVWEILQIENHEVLLSKINQFLYQFGERCLGELKLETISYNQAPDKFIKILQSYINNPSAIGSLNNSQSERLRSEAQEVVRKALKGKFIKKRVFRYFMNKTRELVSSRENLRFERTRGFGIVRTIFSAIGVQFYKKGLIDNERDIFYLTKEEIFDFIKGTSIFSEVRSPIVTRKAMYQSFSEDKFVPERVTTYGVVYDQIDFSVPSEPILEGDLEGIACCPGVIRSEVCVIHSPDEIDDLGGRIMVTSSTDPGWVSLFPTASAILVERGSLLSHSAIVARELGIPCIVGISHLLQKLKTGDVVEMDGSTGKVKIIDDGE